MHTENIKSHTLSQISRGLSSTSLLKMEILRTLSSVDSEASLVNKSHIDIHHPHTRPSLCTIKSH